ncbi:polyprenyl synthetase family protein [Streptomyces sp. NBRC 110028]|uniref:polyprenyl synthetase family protein n=1 Tax=Streptomyces sp. NBRC 110028 TaxID=1621260 RepID=UPI0006E2569F|nr:polyprenyl synthetase family protein [Streptomyces sp. NBRC 110028]
MTAASHTTATAPADPLSAAHPTLARLLRDLESRWPTDGERLHRVSRYALLPAGKLLRPLLLVESARAVGGGYEESLPAALGVEYLHAGSLVHDDVIDGDALRRGRPTVVARYGVADAVVTGDALIMGMFAAVAECADQGLPADRLLTAVRVLARAGIDLCRGQAMEAELCGDVGCGLDRYLTMISLKTGALFRGSCHAGALLGGGDATWQRALTDYAEHLGLAFQMHDDLLPYTSETVATGKSGLSDTANGRPTFPVLMAYERADAAEREALRTALGGTLPAQDAHDAVRRVLDSTGALRAARERTRAEVDRAKDRLAELPSTEGSAVLAAVADFSADRER